MEFTVLRIQVAYIIFNESRKGLKDQTVNAE
jgi:hypothetical protein